MKILAQKIGFIGAGNMAQALIAGLVERGTLHAAQVGVTDTDANQTNKVGARFPVVRLDGAQALVEWADVVVLAVKPQVAPSVLAAAAVALGPTKLLVSICAGISLATLGEKAGNTARLVRVMPNTPALVGEAATAFALGARTTESDGELVESLFSAVGQCVQVPESYLDAVTGLSGSGPGLSCCSSRRLPTAGSALACRGPWRCVWPPKPYSDPRKWFAMASNTRAS